MKSVVPRSLCPCTDEHRNVERNMEAHHGAYSFVRCIRNSKFTAKKSSYISSLLKKLPNMQEPVSAGNALSQNSKM